MAAVTQTRNLYNISGHKTVVTATLTSVLDTNTWDTGLAIVDHVSVLRVEAADAADDLTATGISGGTVTFGVAGTITSARVRAEGV